MATHEQKITKTMVFDFDMGHSFLMLCEIAEKLKTEPQNECVIQTTKNITEIMDLHHKDGFSVKFKIILEKDEPMSGKDQSELLLKKFEGLRK